MSITNESRTSNKNPLNEMKLAFQQETVGGKNQKAADFSEAFPLINEYVAANVSLKAALKIFNDAYGHKVHPPRFRQMLADERKRRNEAGELLVCTACGQLLPAGETATEEFHDQEGQ